MRSLASVVGYGAILAALQGCAGERSNTPPPSYQELKQAELAEERNEFLRETRERLSEVQNDIDHLQTRLDNEKQYVSNEMQASWSQQLFELKQDKSRLEAELQRAQNATPAEWEEMRGNIGGATDTLQAGLNKLGLEVSQALASVSQPEGQDPADAPLAADSGLCPVEVAGADAEVKQQANQLLVLVTTDEEERVPELQRRAQEMAKSTDNYRPAERVTASGAPAAAEKTAPQSGARAQKTADQKPMAKDEPAGQPSSIAVKVTAENMEDGVKLMFTPKRGDLDTLRARLEADAEQLGKGLCRAKPRVSVNQAERTSR